jgi:sigma-B regulation protein RsbU (phosphoserine phosphatase)
MAGRYALQAAQPAPPQQLGDRLRAYLLTRWSGRLLLAASALWLLAAAGLPVPEWLSGPAGFVLFCFALLFAFRLFRYLVRRFLWRIRSKLIVSYLFIAVVPVVLLLAFFAIAGLLTLSLVASYMVASQVERTAQQLKVIAHAVAIGLDRQSEHLPAMLERRLAPARALHPNLAYAYKRPDGALTVSGPAPQALPEWLIARKEFAGLVHEKGKQEVVRAAWSDGQAFLVLEIPLDEALSDAMEQRTGIRVVSGFRVETRERGRGVRIDSAERERASVRVRMQEAREQPGMPTFALADRTDWETGKTEVEPLQIRLQPTLLIRQLSPTSKDIGDALLVRGMTFVGVLFLVVYSVALVLGLMLARSVTKSVHALSRGTERLRAGDFSAQIQVRSRDQLGELAESFNMMARGIQDLLREQAEKERLEEELRIARQIQMSLLPQGTVGVAGLRIAALCLPAAEVGGDYYDLLPLEGSRLGVVVADVSGKGTSAALYMAELKGLVLSLARVYDSPGKLLKEANGILSANMDSRSFVTMTYAVFDVAARRMRYARAGHNPIIQLEHASRRTRVLAPQGLGLGIDRGPRFDAILEEAEVPLAAGDVFLFFTDGVSEAMNERSELFGEDRLRELLEHKQALDSDALKEAILADVRGFVGGASQHDDMTLVILKVA